MIDHLGDPAIVALGKRLACFSQQGFGPPHKVNVLFGGLFRRQRMQGGRIAVKKAQIALVNRFYVMVDAAVVPPIVPSPEQLGGQLDNFRDFQQGVPLIGQPQGFIVQVFVHVALLFQKVNAGICPPRGPVVAGENHVKSAGEMVDGFVNEVRPRFGVAHLRPAQGVEVVQVCVQFSAMQSAWYCGKRKFISAGASVLGVSWNSISRPSTVIFWPVSVM